MRAFSVLFLSSLFALSATSVSARDNPGYPATPDDLRGMASLDCSGSIVRLGRGADAFAVLLTSGHCAHSKTIPSGTALMNAVYDRGDLSVFVGGVTPEKFEPIRVLYATMTGVDLGLIEIKATYRELEIKGAKIYDLATSASESKDATAVSLIAGALSEKRLCKISYSVDTLLDGTSTYRDSIALEEPCATTSPWSGTPLLDANTQKIVGVLASSNSGGEACTSGNPCELNRQGERVAYVGRSYSSRVHGILPCINSVGEISLNLPGCSLQAPLSTSRTKIGSGLWPRPKGKSL